MVSLPRRAVDFGLVLREGDDAGEDEDRLVPRLCWLFERDDCLLGDFFFEACDDFLDEASGGSGVTALLLPRFRS